MEEDQNETIALNDELIMMIDVGKYICLKCDKKFASEASIRTHVAEIHSEILKCNLCEYQTESIKEFEEHLLGFHGDDSDSDTESADSIGEGDETSRNLSRQVVVKKKMAHIKTEPKKDCSESETEFNYGSLGVFEADEDENCRTSARLLVENEYGGSNAEEEEEESAIQINNRDFYYVTLTDEEEKLIDEKNLTCLLCSKKFKQRGNLRRHFAAVHLGHARLKCKLCEFKSSSVIECRKHGFKSHNQRITNSTLDILYLRLCCRLKNMNRRKTFFTMQPRGNNVNIAPKEVVRFQNSILLSKEECKFVNEVELSCLLCNADKFCAKRVLLRHLAVCHLGYKRLQCKYCKFESNFLKECARHLNAFHKEIKADKNVRKYFKGNNFRTSNFGR